MAVFEVWLLVNLLGTNVSKEDTASIFLQNVGTDLQMLMASQPRRPPSVRVSKTDADWFSSQHVTPCYYHAAYRHPPSWNNLQVIRGRKIETDDEAIPLPVS
jgi:hypothetical protein